MSLALHDTADSNIVVAQSSCIHCVQSNQCFVAKLKQNNVKFDIFHARLIQSNEHTFRYGDEVEAIYIVKSGTFKAYLDTPCGEQVTRFYVPGDVIAFENIGGSKHEYSVVALEVSSVCVFPIAPFRQRMSLLLPAWLTQFVTNKLKQETLNQHILSKKSANAQIAAFLLNISNQKKRAGYSAIEFALPMTRDDIANYLGLASETVSRTFSRLQKCGLVRLQKRHITLLDIAYLRCLADNHSLNIQ